MLENADVDEAIQYYENAAKNDPSSHNFHNLACFCHAKSLEEEGENADYWLEKADKTFRTAVSFDDCTASTFTEFANFLIQQAQTEAAIHYLHLAIDLQNDKSGLTYSQKEKSTVPQELHAIIEERNKIELEPKVFAYRLLVHVHMLHGDHNQALDIVAALQATVEQFPTYVHYMLLVFALNEVEEEELAKQFAEKAALLETQPEDDKGENISDLVANLTLLLASKKS